MKVNCSCGKEYQITEAAAGRKVRCHACGAIFRANQDSPPDLAALDPADLPVSQPAYPDVSGTEASNAGQMRPDYLHHLRCEPLPMVVLYGVTLVSVFNGLVFHASGFIVAILFGGVCLMMVRLQRRFMANGDVNPGVVVQSHPCLVATYADMSNQCQVAPCIDIRAFPVARGLGRAPEVGTRLAMLCTYNGTLAEPTWDLMMPQAIVCLTRNQTDIARTLASIPKRDWDELQRHLARIPGNKPGQYRMWEDGQRVLQSETTVGGYIVVGLLLIIACLGPVLWGLRSHQLGSDHGSAGTPVSHGSK